MAPGAHGHNHFDPTRDQVPLGSTLKRLARELRTEKWRLIGALIITAASVATSVASPWLLGRATDVVFTGVISHLISASPSREAAIATLKAQGQDRFAQMLASMDVVPGRGVDYALLGQILLVVIVIYALSSLLGWAAALLLRTAVQNIGWRLRDQIGRKIDALPLSYIDRSARGDLMSRVSNDVDNLTQVLNQTLSQFLQSVLTVIGIIAMMLALSWKLTIAALLVLPVGLVVVGIMMAKAQPHFSAQWKHTGEVAALVEDAISGHETAVLYGLHDHFDQKFEQENTALYTAASRAQFVSNLVMPIMGMVSSVTYVVVAVGGGLLVANGTMTLGSVQAFIQYSRQFMHPMGTLATMSSSVQSGAASAQRVLEFLDAEEETPDVSASAAHSASADSSGSFQGRVVFDHVNFSYEPGTPIIRDLSLTVEPGQMVAIIGPTGAGKTTLVNLLMRFYDIDSGSITIDGVDIRDIPRSDLRARFGMVLQDTWLFDGSISDNIAFGRTGATQEDITQAAQEISVRRIIEHLPEGFNTHLTDEADILSAGERQLMTIARAFISSPDILILDEATSSVDTRTELLVQRALDHLRQGRTAFVIAHRLSTIRQADVILVMDHGDVVEMGTHAQLLERGGMYAQLQAAAR